MKMWMNSVRLVMVKLRLQGYKRTKVRTLRVWSRWVVKSQKDLSSTKKTNSSENWSTPNSRLLRNRVSTRSADMWITAIGAQCVCEVER